MLLPGRNGYDSAAAKLVTASIKSDQPRQLRGPKKRPIAILCLLPGWVLRGPRRVRLITSRVTLITSA